MSEYICFLGSVQVQPPVAVSSVPAIPPRKLVPLNTSQPNTEPISDGFDDLAAARHATGYIVQHFI